ncbi:GumC family protein [Tahibacter amnicola]|uniref:Polysaccharide biosynthesis tyrosine autokinase n=1 Tax=Tahibacter amnicola TaxID=2976241 RepID=A0ABY6BDJ0_9GAMM|nr:polysaccharide biosynthesis tyrosine autokinase [Tahibacter amnicola]UXI66400.1 polysaccharide biosynthesis tyrosine autokinase [Tahibacter amnicola]
MSDHNNLVGHSEGHSPVPRVPALRPAASNVVALRPPHGLLEVRAQEVTPDDPVNLLSYWQILLKRKWVVLSVLATTVVVVLLITLMTPSTYRATATLQIDRDTIKVIQGDGLMPAEGLGDRDFYQTQYELLKSRTLAERVVEQHALGENAVVQRMSAPSVLAGMLALFRSTPAVASEDAAQVVGRDALTQFVLGHLLIEPIRNSRLVRVHFNSLDPQFSATMANAVGDAFIASNIDRRFDASAYAKTYLEDRLQQLKLKLEDSEKQLVEFAQQEGIINIDERQSLASQEMEVINQGLATAQQQRIEAEAKFRRSLQTSGESLPEVLASPVIGQLKQRRAELHAEYQEKLRIYKPGYPAMEQLKGQIDEIDAQLRSEIGRVKGAVKAEFDAAQGKESMLTARLGELKTAVLDMQGRSIKYNIIKREVDTNRQLYDGLLQRYKEIGVAGGIGANNISIVDRARPPLSRFSPSLTRNLLLALLAGMAGGILLALLFEHLDDTIKLPEDVERQFGLAVLGVIPRVRRSSPLVEVKDPRSAFSESYRSVRTALQFSTETGVPRTLFVTSSTPGEGKSTTALTLGLHFAQLGKRVLLIDADLRNPSLHKALGISNAGGLSNYLSGANRPLQFLRPTHEKRLACLCSGPLPPNPAELLAGPKMPALLRLAAESFDQVIIDGPPVLGIADAAILSNLAAGTVLVVESGGTRLGYARGVLKRLLSARARLLGVVLTKLDSRSSGRGYGYGYGYGYGDYGYAYGNAPPARQLAQKATAESLVRH